MKKFSMKIFFSIIDFVRNYTDKHHHGKEESMLFNRMANELGEEAEKLVTYNNKGIQGKYLALIDELEAKL